MKTIFLSVPMKDKTDEEIKEELDFLKQFMEDGDLAIDNFIDQPEGESRLYCLGEAIKKIGLVDEVWMHPDWARARGCRLEEYTAVEYGVKVRYFDKYRKNFS